MPKFWLGPGGLRPQNNHLPGQPTRDQASILKSDIVGIHQVSHSASWPGRGTRRYASRARQLEEWHERKQIIGAHRSRPVPPLGDAKRNAAGVFGAQFLGVARQRPPRGRPQANRYWQRSPTVKERQLSG